MSNNCSAGAAEIRNPNIEIRMEVLGGADMDGVAAQGSGD
jgi:hypothetical protein